MVLTKRARFHQIGNIGSVPRPIYRLMGSSLCFFQFPDVMNEVVSKHHVWRLGELLFGILG